MTSNESRQPQASRTEPSLAARYERRSQLPLTVLAVAFLVVYAVPIVKPTAANEVLLACTIASWTIWVIFAADYGWRLLLSDHKPTFVRSHVLELATVMLPMLRPLRVLRVLSLANLASRRSAGFFVNAAQALAAAVSLLVLLGALAMLDAERGTPEANITTFGDSLWWSVSTIATVGYGDYYPTTLPGRLIATAMMLLGIGLLGIVTAGIAGWAVEHIGRSRRDAPR